MSPNELPGELEQILQRAFLYGCEVGSLEKDYKVSGVKYIPTGELNAINEYIRKAEKVAFIAGCITHGMPDEDAEVYVKAFNEWKEQPHD